MFTWIYQLRLCYKGLYSVVSEIRNYVGVSHNALFRNSLTHSSELSLHLPYGDVYHVNSFHHHCDLLRLEG